MNRPHVAIITPAFKAEAYIETCIRSVSQTVTHDQFTYEHIIIDDGSTDKTGELLKKHSSVVTIISLPENKGHAFARNCGLKETTADWIFFLDADDILLSTSIRHLLTHALALNADWVYGDFLGCDESGNYIIGRDYYGWPFENTAQLLTSLFSGEHFFQQNSLYKKDILTAVNGFTESLHRAVDFDLCTKLLLNGSFPTYVSGALYLHRFHSNNLSIDHESDPQLHLRQVANFYATYKKQLSSVLSGDQIKKIEAVLP